MSFERGFPIPKHGNWSPVTRGMPVPRDGKTSFCQESMTTTTTGRNGDATEKTLSQRNGIAQRATAWKPETPGSSTPQKNGIGQKRNPWTPVTPEKLSKGKKEKQSETSDKWQDFVGVYKEDTVDTKKRNFRRSDESKGAALVSYFKNDPANWKCNHLASIVCSKSSSEAQNHISNSTPLLHVRRKSRKKSTASTSTLGSQQTHKLSSISNRQTSKDGATSSTITESLPIAPITPAKHKVNQHEQENVKISTNEDSPPSAVSTTQKDSIPSVVSTKQKVSTPSAVSATMNDSTPSSVAITQKDPIPSAVSATMNDSTPPSVSTTHKDSTTATSAIMNDSAPSAVSATMNGSTPSAVSSIQKDSPPSAVSSIQKDSPPSAVLTTQKYSPPPSAVSTPEKESPPSIVPITQKDSAVSSTQKDSPPSAVSITQKDSAVPSTQKDSPPFAVSTPQKDSLPSAVSTPQKDLPPSAVSITQKDSPPSEVSITQKDSAVLSTQKDSSPSAVSTPQKDALPSVVSTPQKDSPPSAVSTAQKDSPPSEVSITQKDSPPSEVSITQKDSAVSTAQKDSPPSEVSITQKDSAVSTAQKDSPPSAVSTPQKDSPPSAVSSTQKEPIVPDEKDEHGIDMSKTPQQKTPTRRRKHRPRVIKPQKPKKVKKDGTTPGEPRVKRKYVRRKGVNVSETQPKTPVASTGKRKYVRKKNIDQVKGQQKSTADDTPVKSCKKKLNFDLDINLNSNPLENIEQEKKMNGNQNMPLPVLNVPIPKTTHHALNMLARSMSMSPRENNYNNIVPPNLQNVQQPNLQSINLDERRGLKRQHLAMDSLYLYQKLLLGVAHRSHNHNVFLENHKKRKIQSGPFTENSLQMNGIYNGTPMQLLHSGGQKVNPANFVNCQYQPHPHVFTSIPEGSQFYTQGHEIGWNQPQPIPPNEGIKHGVITYPATSLENKKRVEEKKKMIEEKKKRVEEKKNRVEEKKKRVEKGEVSVDDSTYKLEEEGIKHGVITYPATLLEKKKRVEEKKKRVEKGEVSVDDITYKLKRMRISDKKKGGNEVVLYKGSDAIVPFEPIKKRNQRPKVDLDPETDRLWKLILGKEASEGGETLDNDKEKWWENERKVFRGRADSFIARMHLVQGDRRFSKWKGSVVDSVIGVFLTQNVSDHLSSSAFMALAAKYPRKDSCQAGECERPIEVTEKEDAMKCDENIKEPGTEDSLESTTSQIAEETGSSSGSNSEAEDLTTGQDAQKQESVILEGTPINVEANSKEQNVSPEPQSGTGEGAGASSSKEKKRIAEDERNIAMNWDSLRKEALSNSEKKEESRDARDSLDYEAFRHAPVNEISDAIKERGMNNLLAERMQNFLNRLVRDHGKIDLEWLRDAPPEKAKDYLLSFRGLGLKSVECIRLLTLHHLAFPVDTNVGRIAVRLGWVPLQPLPESLQLHLLEMYPVLDSIQKYLWPRLCKLDQLTLYELHYQMITFGKVFCTKSKPNCNACPMRAECRHFASAFASARLALPCPEEKKIVTSNAPIQTDTTPPPVVITTMPLPLPESENKGEGGCFGNNCEPIIEEPTTPEPEATPELSMSDIEDQYYEDSDEIPSIKLNMEEFTNNLQSLIQDSNKELQDDMSKSLVALTPNAARIPTPKLKDISRLRTAHQVYELPDSHRLLEGLEKREPDDPSPYLLAIWTPGETANSIQPPERECPAQESGGLCDKTTCFSCNSIKEANSQVVRGTILIPCRTATRGSFPLNGTYFQVNEMFADHESSLNPIDVPRAWLWNLPRRTVYFGTSVTTIFRGLSTQGIQYCFWKGFVCVRGFDRKSRAPRPLMARLHFPASKLIKIRNEGK